MEKLEEWFKIKKYPHIGKPITIKDYNWVKNYVNNAQKIRTHSFLPLIHKTIVKRKFRPDKENNLKNPSGKRQRKKYDPKIRDTFFASHLDSMIFSKYNHVLTEKYEKHIKDKPFNESIVAYRKIPLILGKKGNKCNIDFAKSAFDFIKSNNNEKLTVIVADISSFFDNLNHKILKKKWAEVLQMKTLPPDHYNIFKAITNIKYIESQQLFESYDKTMIIERGIANSSSKKEYVRKKVNDSKFFKEKNAVSYCDKDEFLKNNLKLIISKKNERGIPQGSPISATLANIYMIDFDSEIFNYIGNTGGFYQRYCDDLIIVINRKFEDKILKTLNDTIKSVDLPLAPEKTKLYHFENVNLVFTGFAIDLITKVVISNKPLEYLGFSFDGKRVLIKTPGFSKFYRSMKGAINRATYSAIFGQNADNRLFKKRLYKRFTFRGAKRKLLYRQSKENPNIYEKTKKYDWGNYLSYVYKANEIMKSINENDDVKRQARKLWHRFHKLIIESDQIIKNKTPVDNQVDNPAGEY